MQRPRISSDTLRNPFGLQNALLHAMTQPLQALGLGLDSLRFELSEAKLGNNPTATVDELIQLHHTFLGSFAHLRRVQLQQKGHVQTIQVFEHLHPLWGLIASEVKRAGCELKLHEIASQALVECDEALLHRCLFNLCMVMATQVPQRPPAAITLICSQVDQAEDATKNKASLRIQVLGDVRNMTQPNIVTLCASLDAIFQPWGGRQKLCDVKLLGHQEIGFDLYLPIQPQL